MKAFGNKLNSRIAPILLAAVAISLLIAPSRSYQLYAPASIEKPSEDRIALYQAMLDLSNPFTVMCVAAHPDDEDGTSLIVMRHRSGAHTVSLFSTFGEGGQNAIGPELYEELGAIRARETAAAAEIQGSEPHFLGLKDFGYSKSPDETFQKWGHEEALRRMVLEIRRLHPTVIITNHSVTNNDHGHHQATARLVLEAFDAAADPKRFPEQLKDGVSVWQVKRLFVRARGNAAQNPAGTGTGDQFVTIDPNQRDNVRGTTYAEQALSALQKHATQGPWPQTMAQMASRFANSSDGRLPLIRYRLVREAKEAEPLTPNADSFLSGLVIPREMQPRLAVPDDDDPYVSITDKERTLSKLLAQARFFHQRNSTHEINTMPEVAERGKRINAAIAAVAGISVELVPEVKTLVPGTPANFDITLSNHGNNEVQLGLASLDGLGMGSSKPASTPVLAPGQTVKLVREFKTPSEASLTVPHYEHLYDGKTFGEKFTAIVDASIKGGSFQVPATVSVDVAPPVEIVSVNPSPVIFTPQTMNAATTFTLRVLNHENAGVNTSIDVAAGDDRPPKRRTRIKEIPLITGPQEERQLQVTLPFETDLVVTSRTVFTRNGSITPTAGERPLTTNPTLLFGTNDKTSNEIWVPVIYADAHIVPNLNIGYVRGFDYSLPNALGALGVGSKELSADEVKTTDLSKFTSIIVDNRVYESQPELIAANQKLLDYANTGGNLIVFYHKSFEWNPDPRRGRPQLAPYKLILGDERITDENAPVTFLEPDHPLLNVPNKLNQDDFKDWIQERGLYYPKEWDANFHALLQSNDPSEGPLKGGLLVADYGRGHYIYTSMVWYRQLRAGVPGAYRMLANMISYGGASK